MRTARQDAWTPEDDTLLADIILRHVRTGSTQLNAFREAGQSLGRTDSACGFRWNAVVRKQFADAIERAKAERRTHKMSHLHETTIKSAADMQPEKAERTGLSWQQVIQFLQSRKTEAQTISAHLHQLEFDLQTKSLELEQITQENHHLRAELRSMLQDLTQVRQDYLSLLNILERARKEIYLGEPVTEEAPTLQLDDPTPNWTVTDDTDQ